MNGYPSRAVVTWWTVIALVIAGFYAGPFFGWLSVQAATVQAAIYAPAIALIGVILNTWVSGWNTGRQLEHDRKKTSQQLEHERSENEAERKLSLRRDIYLGLAEYILDGINAVTLWADTGLEHRILVDARRRESKYSAQMHLMAGPELVEAAATCVNAIDAAIVDVRLRRDKVTAREAEMRRLRQTVDTHMKQVTAILDRMRSRSLEAPLPNEELERLRAIAEFEAAHAKPSEDDANHIAAGLRHERWELYSFARKRQEELYPLAVRVIHAARAELGETIDDAVYENVLRNAGSTKEEARVRALFGLTPDGN